MREAPSSVHTRVTLQDVCNADRCRYVVDRQVFDNTECRIELLGSLLERDWLLGEIELERTVPMVTDGSTREVVACMPPPSDDQER